MVRLQKGIAHALPGTLLTSLWCARSVLATVQPEPPGWAAACPVFGLSGRVMSCPLDGPMQSARAQRQLPTGEPRSSGTVCRAALEPQIHLLLRLPLRVSPRRARLRDWLLPGFPEDLFELRPLLQRPHMHLQRSATCACCLHGRRVGAEVGGQGHDCYVPARRLPMRRCLSTPKASTCSGCSMTCAEGDACHSPVMQQQSLSNLAADGCRACKPVHDIAGSWSLLDLMLSCFHS